jgi:hypothetical protein
MTASQSILELSEHVYVSTSVQVYILDIELLLKVFLTATPPIAAYNFCLFACSYSIREIPNVT